MPDSPASPVLEARGISKSFGAVRALKGVDASFGAGEVVAVMGENGAGKSTLMKCLAGVHQPDTGEIRWKGGAVKIVSVNRASELGIAFIHQELNLADNLTVAGNIYLGREAVKLGFWLDEAAMREGASKVLAELQVPIRPETRVSDLSIGRQQIVEIGKALSQDAQVIIMDEPTSSLSHGETEALFALVKRLKEAGKTIVFISHRLGEVKEVADRVIVLRDGENSGELAREDINHDSMVKLMVGRDLDLHRRRDGGERGEVRLSVKGLRTPSFPGETVSFELRSGEIVGMAGLVGAGRTELARTIFGIDRMLDGQVSVEGVSVAARSPREAMRAGIAYVPEDRKAHGLIVESTIRDNIALPSLRRYSTAGWVADARLDELAEKNRKELSVRTESIRKPVMQLSGGNQQKVAIGKWIAREPKVFLLDEPTRGVDVGSKDEIYHEIEKIALEGAAVLFISSELEELLRVSDRILVMHEGRITGEVTGKEMTEEAIMTLATGTESKTAA